MTDMTKKHNKRSINTRTDKQTLAAVAASVGEHEAEQPNLLDGIADIVMSSPYEKDDADAAAQVDAVESAVADSNALAGISAEADAIDGEAVIPTAPKRAIHPESLGQRLRAVREARGWSCGDVAAKLHLPVQIVRTIESDRLEAIGHRIYLRGYLTSYVRLMDLPSVIVETALQQHPEPPPLVTSGTISHPRYLFQRYSVSALYLILTGVIIVPAVLLAMRAGMEPRVTELSSLDSPASAIASGNTSATSASSASAPVAPVTGSQAGDGPEAPRVETPLAASMAPFQALSHAPVQPAPAAVTPAAGAHTLHLSVKEASWVEITSSKGEKLQYGILPAGTVRDFNSDYALDVRLGNSTGAEVVLDGQALDLTPYRHSNVAHFKAFTGDQAAQHSD